MLCSLALSAVTLWGVSVTAPAKDARDALRTLKDETLGVMLLIEKTLGLQSVV